MKSHSSSKRKVKEPQDHFPVVAMSVDFTCAPIEFVIV